MGLQPAFTDMMEGVRVLSTNREATLDRYTALRERERIGGTDISADNPSPFHLLSRKIILC